MSGGSKPILALVASTAALALAPDAAEAGTVVAASGPSAGTYSVGTQISDTQRITLREGDVITVLDGGRTRVLRGPGTFVLAARTNAGSRNTALAALTSRRPQARIASSRGVPGADGETNPNIWYVDVATPGTICLSDVDRVNLWRADKTGEAVYSIAPAGSPDDAVQVIFADGDGLARWESALQLRDGMTYTIGRAPDDEAVQVTFKFLSDEPDDGEALAQALISNGCEVQLAQIVAAAQDGAQGEES
ncbi:hypothetical protein GCM10023208_17380 [Erythrobacter westpacificensis]|uniref:Secreted protein n=1 Tax=Erythrobacter westpacificensis TaxID=1055231 RepID=A0ABP9KEW5_9SPHN